MIDLGDQISVTVVATEAEGSPVDLRQYNGRSFAWQPGVPAPVGIDTVRVRFGGQPVELRGFARQVAGEWQWVVVPPEDAFEAAINGIPGPQGWTSQPARKVYRDVYYFLNQEAGVTRAVLVPGLAQLYNAAILNKTQELGL